MVRSGIASGVKGVVVWLSEVTYGASAWYGRADILSHMSGREHTGGGLTRWAPCGKMQNRQLLPR